MDTADRELKFDAILMAIRLGYTNAARRAFEASLKNAANDKLDQIIRIATEKGAFSLVEELQNTRES